MFTFFAVSIGVDQLPQEFDQWRFVAEDGSKLFGIAFGAGYFWKEVRTSIENTIAVESPDGGRGSRSPTERRS